MPRYVFLIEAWLAKISLQNIIPIKSYRGKTLDQEGLNVLNKNYFSANFLGIIIFHQTLMTFVTIRVT